MLEELEEKISCISKKINVLRNYKNLDQFNFKISNLQKDIDQLDYLIDDIIYSIKNVKKNYK